MKSNCYNHLRSCGELGGVALQVKDELQNMVRRLDRMTNVHSIGQSNPHLAPVYHALAETADPMRDPPRELLRCNSDRTAQVHHTPYSCIFPCRRTGNRRGVANILRAGLNDFKRHC